MIAYIAIGVAVGLCAAVVSLLAGCSIGLALLSYSVVGALGMLLVPLVLCVNARLHIGSPHRSSRVAPSSR